VEITETATVGGGPNSSPADIPRDQPPLVSVVIPAYNCERFIDETLRSVFAQSYANIEVIVVDDGSTDGTGAVLSSYDKRICCIRQQNGGLAAARNSGLRRARGKYVAQLDADDLCVADRIATQVEVLETNPTVVVCSSDFSALRDGAIVERSHIASYYSSVSRSENGIRGLYTATGGVAAVSGLTEIDSISHIDGGVYLGDAYPLLVWGNFIHPPTVMVRREIAMRAGDFDTGLRHSADYDWLLRVARLGKAAYVDAPLLLYRYHEGQDSSVRNAGPIMLETIRVVERAAQSDPDLRRANPKRIRGRIGLCQLHAANALVDHSRSKAFSLLAQSVRNGIWKNMSLRVVVKCLVPRKWLQWLRQQRQRMWI